MVQNLILWFSLGCKPNWGVTHVVLSPPHQTRQVAEKRRQVHAIQETCCHRRRGDKSWLEQGKVEKEMSFEDFSRRLKQPPTTPDWLPAWQLVTHLCLDLSEPVTAPAYSTCCMRPSSRPANANLAQSVNLARFSRFPSRLV